MIVKNIIDFSRISYEGNKAANAGHAAYWLAAQHDQELSGALRVQEEAIIEGFKHMAEMLGYRIEKIDVDANAVLQQVDDEDEIRDALDADVPMFRDRPGFDAKTGVPA